MGIYFSLFFVRSPARNPYPKFRLDMCPEPN